MKIDLHNHSFYSHDCVVHIEDVLDAAAESEIDIFAVTDHIDTYGSGSSKDLGFDIKDYLETLDFLKEDYEEMEILKGVEMGLSLENLEDVNKTIDGNDFDFIIGSIHAIDQKDIYTHRQEIEMDVKKYFRAYYEFMLECVKATPNFHVLGHMDYLDRYMENKWALPDTKNYAEIIDAILENLIRTDRGIEYNTAGFRNNLEYGNPKEYILKRYRELGGEIITIGSDAHRTADIGYMIPAGLSYLKKMGFGEIAIYRKKKVHFVEI